MASKQGFQIQRSIQTQKDDATESLNVDSAFSIFLSRFFPTKPNEATWENCNHPFQFVAKIKFEKEKKKRDQIE